MAGVVLGYRCRSGTTEAQVDDMIDGARSRLPRYPCPRLRPLRQTVTPRSWYGGRVISSPNVTISANMWVLHFQRSVCVVGIGAGIFWSPRGHGHGAFSCASPSSISTDGGVGGAKGIVPSCHHHYAKQSLSRVDFQLGLPDGVRPSGAVSGAVVCGDLG